MAPHRDSAMKTHEAGEIPEEFYFFFSFLFFLGSHLWHMVPRPGLQLELQLLACTTDTATPGPSCICNLCRSWWQCWLLNPLSEARYGTRILLDTSWVNPLSGPRNSKLDLSAKGTSWAGYSHVVQDKEGTGCRLNLCGQFHDLRGREEARVAG